MSQLNYSNLAFLPALCPIKSDQSGDTIRPQANKLTIFGIFNELLCTQNENVARFARNVELDFLCDFQTSCYFHFTDLFFF